MPHYCQTKVRRAKRLRTTGTRITAIAARMAVSRGTVRKWLALPTDYFDPVPHYRRLPATTRQILIGSLLGDGSLSWDCNLTASFREHHSEAQSAYLQWKSTLLAPLRAEFNAVGCQLHTARHRGLAALRDAFYPHGIKIVPRKLIYELDSLGLAIWWQDDGHRRPAKPLGRGIRNRVFPHAGCGVLNTQCFTNQDVQWLAEQFFPKQFGLRPRLYRQAVRDATKCWALRFTGPDMLRLSRLIQQHVHPTLQYKLAPL